VSKAPTENQVRRQPICAETYLFTMLGSLELVLLDVELQANPVYGQNEHPADLGLEFISPACFRSLGFCCSMLRDA
jgi:hypothetical protein